MNQPQTPTAWAAYIDTDSNRQDRAQHLLDELAAHGYVVAHRNDLKVAICECLIRINDEVDPVTNEKWGPIVPPTAIDWIGDALVAALTDAP